MLSALQRLIYFSLAEYIDTVIMSFIGVDEELET